MISFLLIIVLVYNPLFLRKWNLQCATAHVRPNHSYSSYLNSFSQPKPSKWKRHRLIEKKGKRKFEVTFEVTMFQETLHRYNDLDFSNSRKIT